jgi:osmotically-inducible protein OsmY
MMLALFVMVTAGAAQDGGSNNPKKPKQAKPAAVDCSRIDDATISSKVKERLASTASLKDAPIVVETRDGAVTLSGTIKSGALKGVATMQARRVDCVKSVNNQMTVEQSRKNPKKDSGAEL